ncbi:MAG: hypothetical protein MJZ26_08960 [Fibrobacter sp.]|nr:hypothetical protein [Fibrobacter sp.]
MKDKKFIYRVETIIASSNEELESYLDGYGCQGWELCVVVGIKFYFKKEVEKIPDRAGEKPNINI